MVGDAFKAFGETVDTHLEKGSIRARRTYSCLFVFIRGSQNAVKAEAQNNDEEQMDPTHGCCVRPVK